MQLIKATNDDLVRDFLFAKDEMAPEVVLAEILDLAAVDNPFVVAEQNHFEEGDRARTGFLPLEE